MKSKDRKYIITFDLGTSGPKVSLFTDKGVYIAHEFEPNSVQILPGGGAEQNPDEWWECICKACKRLLHTTGITSDEILVVSCTAQWSGTVAVNREGNHIHPAVIWMDSRGAKYISKMMDGPMKVQGYSAIKAIRWLNLTAGAPGLAGKDPLAHILFLKNEKPDIYKQTFKFLEVVDYLNLKLTGKFSASHDSITLHWVTDNRNIRNIKYSKELIRLSGIDADKLPELIPTNTVLGNLSQSAAEATGLDTGTAVITGCGDLHSAAVGSGAVRDFEAHYYIGTSSWLVCHLPFRKQDIAHNMTTLPAAIPGRYILANEQETAGACIQYLRDNIFFTKDILSPDGPPVDFYDKMNQLAAEVPAGSGGLLFIPRLYGERSPVEDHHTRGAFFNLSLEHNRSHMIRAVMEGVCMNGRWLLGFVEKNAGKPFAHINMIGGGAKSDIWCQIAADIFNRPIRQMNNPIMANSQGAAFLGALAMKRITVEDIQQYASVKMEYTPIPENVRIYDKLYKEFTHFYQANKKSFHRLNT